MAKKTIHIEGILFEYEDQSEDINYDSVKPLTQDDAMQLLELTSKLFAECGIPMILAYGTLLGAVREHGLIQGDEDLDVITTDSKALLRALPYLHEHGLHPVRILDYLISFKNGKDCYIDVYIKKDFHCNIWKFYCYDVLGHAIPKKYLDELEEIEFLGGRYLKPKDHDGVLTSWYDKNWRVPVRGHDLWVEGEYSYYFWRSKIRPMMMEFIGYPYWRHFLKKGMTQKQSLEEWRKFRNL